jgi:methylglyoxal reductase
MQYIDFKGEKISNLAFGTWGISGDWNSGNQTETEALTVLEAAHENGINLFDTAPVYGRGVTEELLGRVSWKNDVLIATKVPAKVKPEGVLMPNEHYYTREAAFKWVESSLKRLGRDYIDIIQLHNWHPLWNHQAEYFLSPLLELQEQGKLRYIGISLPNNFSTSLEPLLSSGLLDFIQIPYNFTETWAEEYIFRNNERLGVYLLVRSLFAQGVIGKSQEMFEQLKEDDIRRKKYANHFDAIRRDLPTNLESANIYGNLLKYYSKKFSLGSMLVGMRTPEQVVDNCKVF